ncbi:hypothetical protein GQ55_9G386500 [Panicum hallii var. hallii]|uniref:Uncharacterized protein n=1 Tax=Panicum hallii var. hallii TaxID=1504633 RepID=A0A2T7C9P7_9POAL|nr:hypothetical protein GQ55_9G386500 [Panicum hallii var. hallii]
MRRRRRRRREHCPQECRAQHMFSMLPAAPKMCSAAILSSLGKESPAPSQQCSVYATDGWTRPESENDLMELEICVACIDKSGSSLFTAGAGEGEEESGGHFLTVPRHVAAIIGNLLPEMCLPSVDGNRHEK